MIVNSIVVAACCKATTTTIKRRGDERTLALSRLAKNKIGPAASNLAFFAAAAAAATLQPIARLTSAFRRRRRNAKVFVMCGDDDDVVTGDERKKCERAPAFADVVDGRAARSLSSSSSSIARSRQKLRRTHRLNEMAAKRNTRNQKFRLSSTIQTNLHTHKIFCHDSANNRSISSWQKTLKQKWQREANDRNSSGANCASAKNVAYGNGRC